MAVYNRDIPPQTAVEAKNCSLGLTIHCLKSLCGGIGFLSAFHPSSPYSYEKPFVVAPGATVMLWYTPWFPLDTVWPTNKLTGDITLYVRTEALQ